jgi:S1-C subfamily serine protease
MYRRTVCEQRLCPLFALLVFLLFFTGTPVTADCIEPTALIHSTVSLTRHFGEDERQRDPSLLGVRGTAWFLSPQLIVTAGHVAQSMNLSEQNWKDVEIWDGTEKQFNSVRIRSFEGAASERIAVAELRSAVPAAQPLRIRTGPLMPGERVVSLGYPGNILRFASGHFVNYGEAGKLEGAALLEMADGDDRLALDHGASGAPVADCSGRAVAVVSNIFAKSMPFMGQAIRISTAWGSPNIAAVPMSVLAGYLGSE